MNAADWLILGVIGASAAVGFWRGLVVELLSLLAWIAAFWLALRFGSEAAELLVGKIASASARMALAHLLLFVLAVLVGASITWLVGKLVRASGLSGTDRMLGLGFGLLRGVAVLLVLVLLLGFTPMPSDSWWRRSYLLPGFERGALWLRAWLPAAAAREIRFPARIANLDAADEPHPEHTD